MSNLIECPNCKSMMIFENNVYECLICGVGFSEQALDMLRLDNDGK